jgi:predicted DNA repair protein MutK
MVGATYLCYEGAEKVWGRFIGHGGHNDHAPTATVGADAEKQMAAGAIRTDFILSAEIMVIALNEVADQPFWPRLIILAIVAVVITIAVYGVVGAIVKMDDIGLSLTQRRSRFAQRIGRGLVAGMPKLLSALSTIGTVAMLWVGGHILLVGTDSVGWHGPYGLVHHAEDFVHHAVQGVGGLLAWLLNTAVSAVIGLVVGTVVVAILHVLPFGRREKDH